ncbi:MAG: tRNA (adenosine(37)-N6)-threonylcarbamoyltransferase complex dimerization subunit type 1 TsaB [Mariprofundales bacterium]
MNSLLCVDAAQGVGVACLHHDGACFLAEQEAERPHSQTLLPQWEQLLAQAGIGWQQLDGFAVGAGPGSFTGIRVVAATINGLNAILQKPIHTLDSLAILSLQSKYPDPLWVVEDARVNEAFVGCYHQGKNLSAPILLRWEQLQSHVDALPIACYQPKPDNIPNQWLIPDRNRRTQSLAQLTKNITLSPGMPQLINPQYLQPTQAERTLNQQSPTAAD